MRKSPRVQIKRMEELDESICNGVLYDRRMNVNTKGKVCRTVVRPTLMYWEDT